MRISKNRVLDFLTKSQIEKGGYTGSDVAKLAKSIPVSPKALRKRINYWITNDPAFKQLRYLGKQFVPLTIDDFILIDQRLKEKPLGRMSDILREINAADTYNLANARASLSTVFTYTDLKTFEGIDIDSIASRLLEVQK